MSGRSCGKIFVLLLWLFSNFTHLSAGEEPDLPVGLGSSVQSEPASRSDPQLPKGLGSGDAPDLPAGLGVESTKEKQSKVPGVDGFSALEVSGFVEARAGTRLQQDATQKQASIGEARLQLELEHTTHLMTLRAVTDFLYDPVFSDHSVDIQAGTGAVDSREFNAAFRPASWMDLKVGRQILTWGTGDLLFINDLFPKDWNAFLIGRDVEYLKAPSDAIKLAFFSNLISLDLVYIPRFNGDRFIDGSRVSYFNPALGRSAGRDAIINPVTPDDTFIDDELSLRLYRSVGSFETAIYGYSGFWKSPVGFDLLAGRADFPRLTVYGASIRGPLGPGIGHLELGYYDSRDDPSGTNPLIPNEEFRLLLGYEWELAHQLTASVQYYLEHRLDQTSFKESLPAGIRIGDQNRHVMTIRLTSLAMNQNLTISMFNFWSPSDRDGYLRFSAKYKLSDALLLESGVNVFYGDYQDTFFAQFKDNTNFYLGVRMSF
jgi:hypothetical protein